MPVKTDYIEAGSGPLVVLVHSSVAGARQWHSLMDRLSNKFHVIAVNLFGYGKTEKWRGERTQTLEDQAMLLKSFLPTDDNQLSIVGHSFGGSVAMKAAALFQDRVNRLVLIEPNPFYLLNQHGLTDAYQEAVSLRSCITENGHKGQWAKAAEEFANYWTGQGSWDAMPKDRQAKFAAALKPNFYEWDAVMNEQTPLTEWVSKLPDSTTVLSAIDTVGSIEGIVSLMRTHAAHWSFEQIGHGGHMAAMTRPDLVNPIVEDAL